VSAAVARAATERAAVAPAPAERAAASGWLGDCKRGVHDEPHTLQAIADRFGISRERARQLEARLLDRLRPELEAIAA
jgi:hypothetical protein